MLEPAGGCRSLANGESQNGREAADALEIDPAAYRQRLSRARDIVTAFVQARCGIVSTDAPCAAVAALWPPCILAASRRALPRPG
jgi:hypothetical protein